MKWLYLLIIFICSIHATEITEKSQNLSQSIEVMIDKLPSRSASSILDNATFSLNTKGIQNFGYNQHVFWVKIRLTNTSNSSINRLLELNFLPMDYLDAYLFDTNQSLQVHYISGDLRPIYQRVIKNKYHLFPLDFRPNETKIVLLKLQNSGAMVIDPILHVPSDFWEHIYPKRESFITAFLAIIVFFTLYNIILFVSLKEISFVYYFLAMGSMFVMQSTLFGVIYEDASFLGLWNITVAVNVSGALFIIFSVLFVSSYFELDRYIPRVEKIYIRTILALYLPLIILLIMPQTYSKILPIIPLAGMGMIFFILTLAFVGYKRSPISSRYIFIGWLMSGSLMILYILELLGILHIKFVDDLTIRIGTLIEMIFFSFALGDKLKFLKTKTAEAEIKALENEKQMLINAKLATAGEIIGNIAHQWRQPLNRLSMTLLKIQSDLHFNHYIDKKTLLEDVKQSEIILKDMSNTIDLFLNFFADNQTDETFNISESVSDAIFIIHDSLKNNGIDLEFRNDCNYWIKGSKAEFSQVILNLLANSQNALIKKSANNRWIEIDYEKSKNELKISVSDNGGGITIEPIESIFHPYISSGNNKNGAGLGLYIARNLIHRLGGNIYVNNSKDGAIFHINFPLYSQSHIHS